jgi:hypothetical protein
MNLETLLDIATAGGCFGIVIWLFIQFHDDLK